MSSASAPRPLAAVSLKAYLSHDQTLTWLAAVRPAIERHPGVQVAVLPSLTALADAVRTLADVASIGSQQVSVAPVGPYTGEVPAVRLVELGVRYAEIGHAERRRHFGQGDADFAAEVLAARRAGLTPLVCVGESEPGAPEAAVIACIERLERILPAPGADLVVAYEPEWAIGATAPAPADHVRAVLGALRGWFVDRGQGVRLIYGGTAGPGTFASLAPLADGLFLGRRAHDALAFAQVLHEMDAAGVQHDHVAPPVPRTEN